MVRKIKKTIFSCLMATVAGLSGAVLSTKSAELLILLISLFVISLFVFLFHKEKWLNEKVSE